MPNCFSAFSLSLTKSRIFTSFSSSLRSSYDGLSGCVLMMVLEKAGLLIVSTFHGVFFSFNRSSSSCFSSSCFRTSKCFIFDWSWANLSASPVLALIFSCTSVSSFLLTVRSLENFSLTASCSLIRSTRAWWRHRNNDGVSMFGWISSSSSEI